MCVSLKEALRKCLRGGKCGNITSCVCLHARLLVTLLQRLINIHRAGLRSRRVHDGAFWCWSSLAPRLTSCRNIFKDLRLKRADKERHKFRNIPNSCSACTRSLAFLQTGHSREEKGEVELKSGLKCAGGLTLGCPVGTYENRRGPWKWGSSRCAHSSLNESVCQEWVFTMHGRTLALLAAPRVSLISLSLEAQCERIFRGGLRGCKHSVLAH